MTYVTSRTKHHKKSGNCDGHVSVGGCWEMESSEVISVGSSETESVTLCDMTLCVFLQRNAFSSWICVFCRGQLTISSLFLKPSRR